jgi:DNA-binding transcriptional regulator YdaS (Cro superfamily)
MKNMTKKQAMEIFGTGAALARALGITRGAVWQWGSELDQKQTAMVIGAAVQMGKTVPASFIAEPEQAAA